VHAGYFASQKLEEETFLVFICSISGTDKEIIGDMIEDFSAVIHYATEKIVMLITSQQAY
jgi:hypothetical protein